MRKFRHPLFLYIFLCSSLLTWNSGNLHAHPLGNFSLNHFTLIELQAQGFTSQHVLDMAETTSFQELTRVDLDTNNLVTQNEIESYKEYVLQNYVPNFEFHVSQPDGTLNTVSPQVEKIDVTFSRGEGSITCMQILFAFRFPLSDLGDQPVKIFFHDTNLAHIQGLRQVTVIRHANQTKDIVKIHSSDPTSTVQNVDGSWIVGGTEAFITYEPLREAKADPALTFAAVNDYIPPVLIPQFPLESNADGSYTILKSPIEVNMDVQNKIAVLQPRKQLDANALLGTSQAQPATENALAEKSGVTESQWSQLIGADELSFSFILLAVLISIIAGASHALSPGHGKTVVAAYLVGSRGTVMHAIFLGIVVTLTHVSSVLILGLITLLGQAYIVSEQLYPIIECASGLIIIIMGIAIFWRRFGAYQRIQLAKSMGIPQVAFAHGHSHGPSHGHSHGPGHTHSHHDHAHPHEREEHVHEHHHHGHEHEHVHPHVPEHSHHDHAHHDHAHHDHAHHDHSHNHDHGHTHSHHHDHEHGEHTHWGVFKHSHDIPAEATWRDLLILGITGGIVPCPAAIMVLLAAIALHRILFGMMLIVFFSVGLATVLITIGILMVTARKLFDRMRSPEEKLGFLQLVSPILVTILGFVIMIRGLQTAGVLTINL